MNKVKINPWKDNEFICKPIDTYNGIDVFLQNPPAWRTLCKELKSHSQSMIKNMDLTNRFVDRNFIEDGADTFCHFSPDTDDVPRIENKNLPRTLVCHDMANGYHDDSIIEGTGKYDAYTFYNWAGIDIFCYFSHHLITIPPLAWINVAHEHGVKVIGTVITEWADGIVFWDKVLGSEAEYKLFASTLVAIAKTLKFDGWLLNVENKISKPGVLLEFVKHLHEILHQELPDAELIWYDSVTIDGHLNWQNALNSKNRAFFDACDGLFTNYSWSEEDVRSSAEEAEAAGRLRDLFVGIDVWGRNFYGGGQFNVQEAVEVAHRHGCSLAVFAPAWTHEAMSLEPHDVNAVALAANLQPYGHFLLRDRALWDSLWRYLYTRLPSSLPFKTSFCRGQGMKRWLYGEVLCPVPWYNLRHMQYQPNSSHGPHRYLLSTAAKIIQVSQYQLANDSEAIKSSEIVDGEGSIQINISDAETRAQSNDALPKCTSTVHEEATDNVDVSPNCSEEKTKDCKRKMKDILKNIFHKPKVPKEDLHEEGVEQEPAELPCRGKSALGKRLRTREVKVRVDLEEDKEQTEETSYRRRLSSDAVSTSTARSMVQMSINLMLGHKLDKTRYYLALIEDDSDCLEVYFEDGFVGGSCLKVNPGENRLIRIFHCDFFCGDTVIVCVVTKTLPDHRDQFLNVHLFMKDERGEDARVVLVGRSVSPQPHTATRAALLDYLYPLNSTSKSVFRDLQKYMLLNDPDSYIPVDNAFNWVVRYYEVRMAGARITSINCATGLQQGPILLGYLGLCQKNSTENSN